MGSSVWSTNPDSRITKRTIPIPVHATVHPAWTLRIVTRVATSSPSPSVSSNRDTLYENDYRALLAIHRLAAQRGLGAMALHHTRKLEADDPLDTISGSLGLVGCADTALVLARAPRGTTLYVRGRDIEEREHAVSFSSEACRWTVLGDAAEVQRSETRSTILEVLGAATESLSPEQIGVATGLKRNTVDQRLYRMVKSGEVIQYGRGRYAHPDKAKVLSSHKSRKA
jgi:hypothetical protein